MSDCGCREKVYNYKGYRNGAQVYQGYIVHAVPCPLFFQTEGDPTQYRYDTGE